MNAAPAPWSLRGDGYMIFYKFSREFVEQLGFVPPELTGKFDGYLGSVMLVNYQSSPVGPYRELLFIPGKFKLDDKNGINARPQSITKIYVNSEKSTQNGRENWGIPKETAVFRRNLVDKNFITGDTECIELLDANGKPFFSITLRAFGLSFPITTAMMPIHLMQNLNDKTYFTTPSGKGKGQLVSIKDLKINGDYFPDLTQAKPLMAIKVSDFTMEFPDAVML
jgi:hypothetical protein